MIIRVCKVVLRRLLTLSWGIALVSLTWVFGFASELSAQSITTSLDVPYYPDDMAWSPDGTLLAVSGSDGIYIYSPELVLRAHFQQAAARLALSLSWHPDSTQLASVGEGSIHIWHRQTNDAFTLEQTLTLPGYLQIRVSWSPSGDQLASQDLPNLEEWMGTASRVHIWETATWTLERTLTEKYYNGEFSTPYRLAWNADGTRFAVTGENEVYGYGTHIIDANTGERTDSFPSVHLTTAASWFGNDLLAVGTDGGSFIVYSTAARQILVSIGYPMAQLEHVTDVEWNVDGTMLVLESRGTGNGIWDYSTGQRIGSLPGAYRLRWNPEGTQIAAIGVNQNTNSRALRIWDVNGVDIPTGNPTFTPYPTTSGVLQLDLIATPTPSAHARYTAGPPVPASPYPASATP